MPKLYSFAFLFFIAITLSAQDSGGREKDFYRFMFYNCENFFDTEDDPEKNDEEFLPNDGKFWNKYRYEAKLFHIYQVITAVGEWKAPEMIGLCELENRNVLVDLITKTPLVNAGYKIIHYESPDSRGIDVGFLYRERYFEPLVHYPIPVVFPDNSRSTRDVLYVKGVLNTGDTLHVFINHWPSRWGGQLETESKREFAASVVRHHVDSLFAVFENPNIIISGDMNDYPENKSMMETLDARTTGYEQPRPEVLYNLSYYLQKEKQQGSHKYQGEWGVLDQIVVSGSLLEKDAALQTSPELANVYMADFLLEEDERYTGKLPFRTYIGYKYHGGYSDHLPVYMDIFPKVE